MRDDGFTAGTLSAATDTRAETATGAYYGWRIVAVAFLTHCLTVGCVFYSFGVFFTPLLDEFGWSRAQLSWGFSSISIFGALYSPFVGRIVDRYGPRPSQLFGVVVLGVTFMLLSRVQSLVQYYLLLALLLSLGSSSLGPIPSNSAVAGWFLRRRGQALGLATAGISMGGVVFVPLAHALIEYLGWRRAFVALGATVLAAGLLPVALVMRKPPRDLPAIERGARGKRTELAGELERSVTAREAVRDRNFWLIAAAFALTVMGLSAILLHQIPLLIDLGVSPSHASFALAATAGVGVVGKLGFGALLDRFDQRRVIVACFLLQAAGLLLLPFAGTPAVLVLYVLIYGYAMGGNATLQATILGECFGRLHYGAIAGRMSPFIVLSQAAAVPIVGWLRDRTGTYMPAIALISLTTFAAAVCISRLRVPSGAHRSHSGTGGDSSV
jgi:MFS transporter, OFA family, oxalate/formate antiporter